MIFTIDAGLFTFLFGAASLAAHQSGQRPTDDQTAVAIHVQG